MPHQPTSNRLALAITSVQARVDALDAAKRDALDASMAIDAMEHFAYQEAQAHAHASGILTVDEALLIYNALGEIMSSDNGGWQPHVDTATKCIVTQVIGELVKAKIAAR